MIRDWFSDLGEEFIYLLSKHPIAPDAICLQKTAYAVKKIFLQFLYQSSISTYSTFFPHMAVFDEEN